MGSDVTIGEAFEDAAVEGAIAEQKNATHDGSRFLRI